MTTNRTKLQQAPVEGAIASRKQRGSTILSALLLLSLFAGVAALGLQMRQKYLAHTLDAADARAAAWHAATRGCRRQPAVSRRLLSRGFDRGFPRSARAFYPKGAADMGIERSARAGAEFGTSIACNEPPAATDSELHEAEAHFRRYLLPSLR